MNSDNSIAIVTGAASGIGYATALRLAEAGNSIVAVDVDAEGLRRTESAIRGTGGQVGSHAFDIRDEVAFEELLARVGTPGILANVAGVGVAAPAADTSTADWDRVIGINLTATFTTCRAVLPGMVAAGGGIIVNVGSIAGVVGVRNRAAYCASKGGVIALTRSIAADYAGQGIRVNAICPGTVASEWIGKI
ncbi:MAG: SDR family NAD(P)-dependent oxidoreductase, partial [Stackebrandtia sp.]